jgi:hypothetical protein
MQCTGCGLGWIRSFDAAGTTSGVNGNALIALNHRNEPLRWHLLESFIQLFYNDLIWAWKHQASMPLYFNLRGEEFYG